MRGKFVHDSDGVMGIKLQLETENPDEAFALQRFTEAMCEPDTVIESRGWLVALPSDEKPTPRPSTLCFRVMKQENPN